MFALVNLGVPDLLAKQGPMSAVQLAAAINAASLSTSTTPSQVPALWLDRLLTAAAALGMLAMSKSSKKQQQQDEQLLVKVHNAGNGEEGVCSAPGYGPVLAVC